MSLNFFTGDVLPISVVPSVFGMKDHFRGRQFFHGSKGWRGWFQDDSRALHLPCSLFLLLLHQLHPRSSSIRSRRLGTSAWHNQPGCTLIGRKPVLCIFVLSIVALDECLWAEFLKYWFTYLTVLGLSCSTGTFDLCYVVWGLFLRRTDSPVMALGLESSWAPVVAVLRLSCSRACGILVPRPGTEPVSPASQSRFLTTGPPGRPCGLDFIAAGLWVCTGGGGWWRRHHSRGCLSPPPALCVSCHHVNWSPDHGIRSPRAVKLL